MTAERQTLKDIEWLADELARALAYVEFWYEQQLKALELAVPSSGTGTPGQAHLSTHPTSAEVAAQRAKADQLLGRARSLGETADDLLARAGLPALPSYVVPAEPDAVYTDQAYSELRQAVARAEALAAQMGVIVPTRSEVARSSTRSVAARRASGLPDDLDADSDEPVAEDVPEPDAPAGSNLFLWGALAVAAIFACLMTIVAGVAVVLLVSDVLGR